MKYHICPRCICPVCQITSPGLVSADIKTVHLMMIDLLHWLTRPSLQPREVLEVFLVVFQVSWRRACGGFPMA